MGRVAELAGLSALSLLLALTPGAIEQPPSAAAASCPWDTSHGWVKRENAKIGDPGWADGIRMEYSGDYTRQGHDSSVSKWMPNAVGPTPVEGWFDRSSAGCGESASLHISGNGKPVTVKVFRMGYYGGAGARLIESSTVSSVPEYSAPKITRPPESTVTTDWPVAWSLKIDAQTPPGQYLIRLDDAGKDSNFVPLTILDPNIKSEITFVSAVLTWQAYNQWGGYSLYKGPDSRRATRSTVSSLNRPFDGDGSGQFRYMQFPILKIAERLGIDMNYITDIDLDRGIASLRSTLSILYGGHGEYWTTKMRAQLQAAVDRGTNLVVLGGNTGYARPRLQDDGRQLVMWRASKLDPNRTNPALATTSWRARPISQPESRLLGAQYVGLGVDGNYTIPHPQRWPFTKMTHPDVLKNVVGREVDSPLYTIGPAVETLAESAITFHKRGIRILATYYTNSAQAGVINISTNGWTCVIDDVCPWHPQIDPITQLDTRLITEEILIGLTRGPLGAWRPAITDIPARIRVSKRQRI